MQTKEKFVDTTIDSCCSPVNDVVVYTYATHSQDLFPVLRESAQRYGYRLKVLGWGEKWRGYCAKLLQVREKLRKEHPDTLVLCVDAFDVFLCRPASELRAEFEASGHKFVIGAHRPATNDTVHRMRFNEKNDDEAGPYKFLCAGTWLARAKDALHILSQFEQLEPGMDDQEMFIALRQKMGPQQIALDKDFRFFATLSPTLPFWSIDPRDQIVVQKDSKTGLPRLYSKLKRTQPFVVHGPAQVNLKPLVSEFEFETKTEPVSASFLAEKFIYHASSTATIFCKELFACALVLALVSFVVWRIFRRKQTHPKNQSNSSLLAKVRSVHDDNNNLVSAAIA